MIKIAPSILSGDFGNMSESVRKVQEWGADIVHCDVMDGVYVKNITFGMPMIKAIRKDTLLPLDVHLMITKPENYVEEFVKSGADMVSFHPDASDNPLETLKIIKKAGAKAGLVFNPNIDFEPYKECFQLCDFILVMSVYAGYGGQKFIPEVLQKVKGIKEYLTQNNLNIPIEIDGGINTDNAKSVIDSGVTILVAGSSVFKSHNPSQTIKELRC